MNRKRRIKELEAALQQCRVAFRYTREYVQPKVSLPALPGWTWYEADCAAARALGQPETPRLLANAETHAVTPR